jgi:hypothetical protein
MRNGGEKMKYIYNITIIIIIIIKDFNCSLFTEETIANDATIQLKLQAKADCISLYFYWSPARPHLLASIRLWPRASEL